MAALQTKRGVSLLVYAIIGIIIAVLMLTFMSTIVGDFLSEYPTVSGTVIPDKVICFSGGEDNSVHCLWKVGEELAGQEAFTFTKAKKWKANIFSPTPVLREDGLYFAVGNHVCAYNLGGSLWNNCYVSSGTIITNLAVNNRLVCFGTSQKKYECLIRDSGIFAYQKEASPHIASSKTESTPKLTEDFLYLAMDQQIIKHNALTGSEIWRSNAGINWQGQKSGIEVENGVICFEPNDNDQSFVCMSDADGSYLWSKSGAATNSKPIIENGFVYFAIDRKLYKQHTIKDNTGDFTDTTGEATVDLSAGVSTDLVKNDNYICSGNNDAYENGWIYCHDKKSLKELFFIGPPVKDNSLFDWDYHNALSTPAFSNNYLYFGLGDGVCAYDLSKPVESIRVADKDTEWCADYDYQIESGIAVLQDSIPAEVK